MMTKWNKETLYLIIQNKKTTPMHTLKVSRHTKHKKQTKNGKSGQDALGGLWDPYL